MAAFFLWMKFFPRTRFGKMIVLNTEITKASGFTSQKDDMIDLQDQTGVALTALRPSGMAQFGEQRVDVVSSGEFINSGDAVVVVRVDSNRVVVSRSDEGKAI
jgi:membrane-bound serine protease (ClpP class)